MTRLTYDWFIFIRFYQRRSSWLGGFHWWIRYVKSRNYLQVVILLRFKSLASLYKFSICQFVFLNPQSFVFSKFCFLVLHNFFQLANLVLISLFILNHCIFWIARSQWAATVRINERAQFWGTKYIFRWSGYHHLGLRCSQTSVITIRIQRIVSEIIILNRFFCSSRWMIYRRCDHQVW